MNEELKIIIKVINDSAKKAVKEVRDELDKVKDSSQKNSKSIGDSMKTIAKGAAIAAGAIATVTGALVAFGKSTIEAQKNFSKLNTAFLAAGGTTKQAGETYKNLYRFMGDSDAATEAAQQLALITTNEKDLTEWTKILQGVYATMGTTLPIESLAEAANETIKVGKVTGTMADALNWAGVSEDAFNARLAQTTSLSEREALVRSTLNNLYMNAANIYESNNQALLAYNQSQANLDIALARAGQAILPLMTALNNLAATLLTILRPAFEIVAGVIATFVSYIIVAISWVSAFFSIFSGGGKKAKKVSNDIKDTNKNIKGLYGGIGGVGAGLNKAAAAAKELKKQTMGFDELNIVNSQDATGSSGGGGAGGGGGGAPMPDMSALIDDVPSLDKFTSDLEEAKKKAEGVMALVAAIALGLGLWKIGSFISGIISAKKLLSKLGDEYIYQKIFREQTQEHLDNMTAKIKHFAGLIMIVAGAILTVQGYSDAWINGIDWGNFAEILAGLALVGGLALAFSPIAAGVGLLAGGIALVILGI